MTTFVFGRLIPGCGPAETGFCPGVPSLDLVRRYLRTSSNANRLLTVDKAASFMAVALATISAWLPPVLAVLKVPVIGVLTIDAQLPLPALYGESKGKSPGFLSGAVRVVCWIVLLLDNCGRGERSPPDGVGCTN